MDKESGKVKVDWQGAAISTKDTLYIEHSDKILYVVTQRKLSAFFIETGKLKFEASLTDGIYHQRDLQLHSPYLIISSKDENLQIFDEHTGALLWQKAHKKNWDESLLVFGKNIGWLTYGVLSAQEKELGYLQFYDLDTGKESSRLVPKGAMDWDHNRSTLNHESILIQDPKKPWLIYVSVGCSSSAKSCHLQKWDAQTGSMIWSKELPANLVPNDHANRYCFLSKNHLLFSRKHQLTSMDVKSGEAKTFVGPEKYDVYPTYEYDDKLAVVARSNVGSEKFELWNFSLSEPALAPQVLKVYYVGKDIFFMRKEPKVIYSPKGIQLLTAEDSETGGMTELIYELFDWKSGAVMKKYKVEVKYPRLLDFSSQSLMIKPSPFGGILHIDLDTGSQQLLWP